jgi:putative (di)nucleoside polyphosphate hydrolase
VAEHPEWLKYDFDARTKARLGASMDAYRGQRQKYFLMRFTGDDSGINVAVPGHKQEFDAYEWVQLSSVADRVAGFKRAVYSEVAREFGPIIERELVLQSANHRR